MKVKAVDIARALGLSKATVSLALNGKAGVREETRAAILDCKARLERGEVPAALKPALPAAQPNESEPKNKPIVKILLCLTGLNIAYNSEMDLWSETLTAYDTEAKRNGWEISISFANIRENHMEEIIALCEAENICGVILHATELSDADIRQLETIKKPLVIYDNISPSHTHNCVVAANFYAVKHATEQLLAKRHSDIIYFRHSASIYNFTERREGFCYALKKVGIPKPETRMTPLGSSIDEIYQNTLSYLQSHPLPSAIIMENYQISVGVFRAFVESDFQALQQIQLIGVDQISRYLTAGQQLSCITVPHGQRAHLAMSLLADTIAKPSAYPCKVVVDCPFLAGETAEL